MYDEKLLGDKIEDALKKVGADKVAKVVEKITKKPCGCAGRKKKINEWHRRQLERQRLIREAEKIVEESKEK